MRSYLGQKEKLIWKRIHFKKQTARCLFKKKNFFLRLLFSLVLKSLDFSSYDKHNLSIWQQPTDDVLGSRRKKNLLSDSKIELQVSDVSKISSLPKTIDWNPQSDVSKKANCLKKFVQTSITFLNFFLAKKVLFDWGSPAGYEL